MSFRLELPSNSLLVGMTRSGKSHLLKCIMGLHMDFFNYGVVFCSTAFNGGYNYINSEYIYEDYDEDVVLNIMEMQKQHVIANQQDRRKKIPECFIIIDDNMGLMEFHKKRNIFDVLFAKSRHLHISIFLCIQACSYLSTAIRANSMYVFITVIKNTSKKMMYEISRGFKSEKEFYDFLDNNCRDYRIVMFDNTDAYGKFTKIIRAPKEIPHFYMDY